MKSCTVSYARSRFRNGTTNSARESRFLKDIDSRYLKLDNKTTGGQEGVSGGFWDSMRQNSNKDREKRVSSNYSSFKEASRKTPVKDLSGSSSQLSEVANILNTGDIIEHERFGRGVVSAIEDSGANKRAFVDFDSAGQKQLLLKYAKFKIVK